MPIGGVLEKIMRSALLLVLLAAPSFAQAPIAKPVDAKVTTIAGKTAGMKHMAGFLPMNWDAKAGKLYLEIPKLDSDMI